MKLDISNSIYYDYNKKKHEGKRVLRGLSWGLAALPQPMFLSCSTPNLFLTSTMYMIQFGIVVGSILSSIAEIPMVPQNGHFFKILELETSNCCSEKLRRVTNRYDS